MKSLEENEETHWRCPCRYHFVKLEGLLQNQVTASQFFVNLIKLAFLNALTIMKDFNENAELINAALD